jgi:phosphoglycolate phosphatase-like HAD superfamily hydrolase
VQDRIATFDNDGTIWSEQPAYFQLYFAIAEIKKRASKHPEWANTQPFKAVLENNMKALSQSGEKGLIELVMISHAGISTAKFKQIVKAWADTATNPEKHRRFTSLVYKPMLELLKYLQDNGFKTYIVSGGGVDFMRAIIPELYNIPPWQIIGSTLKAKYVSNNGSPEIIKLSKIDFINDKNGKPISINQIIGKKPVFCAGNSDGDLAMMQWTASNTHKNFELYVHHTDAQREWAYDKNSHIGRLDKGLVQAKADGWCVVDMKNDWKTIFINN